METSRSHAFALAAHAWAMETTSGPEPGWEKAHTPLPQPEGDEWVWLPYDLHQIHGLLQAEDVGRCCFSGRAKKFLEENFCDDWFELWDLYDTWAGNQVSAFWFIVHPNCHWEVVISLRKFAAKHCLNYSALMGATKRGSSHKGFKAYKLPTPERVPTHFKLSFT